MASNRRDGSSSNTPNSLSKIHYVVDNSNLFIGAQSGQGTNGKQDFSIRINVANLVKIIENGRRLKNIKTRIVGGSIPPKNARVWTEWEKCNYTCLLGERSANKREVFLDDMLHSQIQNLILKNIRNEQNDEQNLVLITGDGNSNDNRTSFPEVVTIALENNWTVDIWSWKATLSRKFLDLQRKYPSKLKINYLDSFRTQITFKGQQRKEEFNYMKYITFIFIIIIIILFLIYYFLF